MRGRSLVHDLLGPSISGLAHCGGPRQRGMMPAIEVILLQNSKVAGPRIFRENTKREAIADSYNLNRIAEVAREFNVRR